MSRYKFSCLMKKAISHVRKMAYEFRIIISLLQSGRSKTSRENRIYFETRVNELVYLGLVVPEF